VVSVGKTKKGQTVGAVVRTVETYTLYLLLRTPNLILKIYLFVLCKKALVVSVGKTKKGNDK
jgi:hypothetical protein